MSTKQQIDALGAARTNNATLRLMIIVVAAMGDERLSELARMLAGTDSPTARAHAAELLSSADVAR